MRIAAIYDIHGNLPALEAVLNDIRVAGVDEIVVGGDIFPGPMPGEVLDLLLSLEIPVAMIRGNGDRMVLERISGRELTSLPKIYMDIMYWNAEQTRSEHEKVMRTWPETVSREIPGLGKVLFCHATPRNDTEVFLSTTPEAALFPVFAGVDAALVVCGHSHMQFDRQVGEIRVVNAGSVGSPYGDPGAYWLLLGPDVDLRKTTYDFAAAAALVLKTDYPQAVQFAQDLQSPASESKMLALFSTMALDSKPPS
jgi:putative phosphoesterase